MILHVISNDKFSPQLIDIIEKDFSFEEHKVAVLTYHGERYVQNPTPKGVELIYKNAKSFLKLASYMRQAEGIIIHGLFSRAEQVVLLLSNSIHKSYIALWGGDLHCYEYETKARLKLMGHVLRNCRGITMELEEDYYLARKWYRTNVPYFPCMLYYSNIVDEKVGDEWAFTKQSDRFVVQLGNSADSSNRHIEVLDMIKAYKDQPVNLIIPLSYVDHNNYASKVEEKAADTFGEKARILKEFMPFDQYLELLKSVNIAIFAHKRQQGLGNIFTLLSMGKKLYLQSTTTVFKSFAKMGIKVYPLEDLEEHMLEPMSLQETLNNQKIVKEICSRKKLISDWQRIFDDIHEHNK